MNLAVHQSGSWSHGECLGQVLMERSQGWMEYCGMVHCDSSSRVSSFILRALSAPGVRLMRHSLLFLGAVALCGCVCTNGSPVTKKPHLIFVMVDGTRSKSSR